MKKAKRKFNKPKHRATAISKSKAQVASEILKQIAPIKTSAAVEVFLPRRPGGRR